MIHEISKNNEWFKKRSTLSLSIIMIVLTGPDIYSWKLLDSNIARLEIFDAPFSDEAKTILSWCSAVHPFIKDLPNLIIQVCYYYKVFFFKKSTR